MIDRLVLASPGGWGAPSARYRLGPLRDAGIWRIDAISAGSEPSRAAIDALVELGGEGAVLILQRALPSSADLPELRARYRRLVFDFDDALYAVPPDASSSRLRTLSKRAARVVVRGSPHASARRARLQRVLDVVDVAVAGNTILGDFARRFASRVVEIPTTVQPVATSPSSRASPPVIVWMGLADNLQYLRLVGPALEKLSGELQFHFRVISTKTWEDSPIPVDFVPWSEEALASELSSASVGLAPLTDGPWTRGKCAFRAIQYGGHALPTVASPVGVTDQVVLDGQTGYHAGTDDQWERALRALLTDPDRVRQMGDAALRHIRSTFSDSVALAAWRELLESLDLDDR